MTIKIVCDDAFNHLQNNSYEAIVTSLPDAEELGMNIEEWKVWFQKAAALCIEKSNQTVFFQTDRRHNKHWISKLNLILNATDKQPRWCKIVLRLDAGKTNLQRPTYAHLIAFGGTGPKVTNSDVLPPSKSLYENGTPIGAATKAFEWIDAETVCDPFAGQGGFLVPFHEAGIECTAVDIDPEQCKATETNFKPTPTPIEKYDDLYIKREDLFSVAGVKGGKARACWQLAQNAKGLVTAGSRSSPQVNIVAHIAKHMSIPCKCHTPEGKLSSEVLSAKEAGADIQQEPYGYNTVIIKAARETAKDLDWTYIPFGMECEEAVHQTAQQVQGIPKKVKRIVIPVGSGISLCGLLHGLKAAKLDIPVLGVRVGANPTKNLKKYAPEDWEDMVELVDAGVKYEKEIYPKDFPIQLDPIYEAKCVKFLSKNDLLWVVGIRQSVLS